MFHGNSSNAGSRDMPVVGAANRPLASTLNEVEQLTSGKSVNLKVATFVDADNWEHQILVPEEG